MKNNISIDLPQDLAEQIKTYCTMTKSKKEDIFLQALELFLFPYKADEGYPREAIYLKGSSGVELQMAKNEGKEPEITKEPCFILGKSSVFGTEYYRIIANKRLMKVPKDSVQEKNS